MFKILLTVAFRNIFQQPAKTLIVGSILILGSFLAVLGNSIVDAISSGLKNSITQSVTGEIQVYSDQAREALSVFGNVDGSPSDVGFVNSFDKIRADLMTVSNVKAVVPMGSSFALINPGNILDVQTEKLRKLFRANVDPLAIDEVKAHLRLVMEDLQSSVAENRAQNILLPIEEIGNAKENVEQALAPKFWQNFDQNYESRLEFIANRLAPLIVDASMLYFGYIGTDPDIFRANFPQFEIVKGEMIPAGARGFLIHDYIYENFVKNRMARRFDSLKKEITEAQKKIADSKELQDQIKASKEQIPEMILSISPNNRIAVADKLQVFLKENGQELTTLMATFMELTDENFSARYQFFYSVLAPVIDLYKIKVGEIVPLSAFTKLGTSSSANVKVWGTFHFKSFENSPLAGNFSIVDMTTFRELYGFLTEARRAQYREIEAEMGAKEMSKDELEQMFGADKSGASQKAAAGKTEEIAEKKPLQKLGDSDPGVFLNAAVILKDGNSIDATLKELGNLNKEKMLGLKIVPWQEASGVIGQMTLALRLLLFLFVLILFGIASLMIMNSLIMAALDRGQEIGTMRAMGAPRSFVYQVFLVESLMSSLMFSLFGGFLACLVIWIEGTKGIPASGEVAKFFFSGPRLYFHMQWGATGLVLLIIFVLSFLATQYPAWRAMQISPLRAMQKKE